MQLSLVISIVATVAFVLLTALVVMSTVALPTTDDGGKSDMEKSDGGKLDGEQSVEMSDSRTVSGAEASDIGISDITSITNSFDGTSDVGTSDSGRLISGSSVSKSTATSDASNPTTRENRRSIRIRTALSYARALSRLRTRRSANTRVTRHSRGQAGSQRNSMAHRQSRKSAQSSKTSTSSFQLPAAAGQSSYDGVIDEDGSCKCLTRPNYHIHVNNHIQQTQRQEQVQAQKQAQGQAQKGNQCKFGDWSGWSEWSTCNRKCNGGLQHRHRDCSNWPCIGDRQDVKLCARRNCKEKGQFGSVLRKAKKPKEALNQYNLLDATSKPTEPVETEVTECYTPGRRGSYTGHLSTTKNNKTCQRWDSQTPHRHKQKPTLFIGDNEKFPENYCRVVDIARPWCYTTEPGIRLDFCDIPVCEFDCHQSPESFVLTLTTEWIKKGPRTAFAHLKCILYYANAHQQTEILGKKEPIIAGTSLEIVIPPQFSGRVNNFSVVLPNDGNNNDEWTGNVSHTSTMFWINTTLGLWINLPYRKSDLSYARIISTTVGHLPQKSEVTATMKIQRQGLNMWCREEIDLRPGPMHYQVCKDKY